MLASLTLLIALGVASSSLVADLQGARPEYCAQLTSVYATAWEFADTVVASCNQERGPKNCMVFGSMWSSSFRSGLSKISSALGCTTETATIDLASACTTMSNIGSTSTKVLRDIFADIRNSPLNKVADEIIPELAKLAHTLVKPIKSDLCTM